MLQGLHEIAQTLPPRELLTWRFLKEPVAISCAMLGGSLITILSNALDPNDVLSLVWIAAPVSLVMMYGSAEMVLVATVFRVTGTVLAVGMGSLLAFGHSRLVADGVGAVGLYAYQLTLQAFVIFLMAVGTRLYPRLHNVFVIASVTNASLLFTPTFRFTETVALSFLLAMGCVITATILFHYTQSEELLFFEHRKAVENVCTLAEFAISSEHHAKKEFNSIADEISISLSSVSTIWFAYLQWRRLTFRSVSYDFHRLTFALRPLYYEVYSLYWSHTETSLRPREASRLYCNTSHDYRTLFQPLIRGVLRGVSRCKLSLSILLQPTSISALQRRVEIDGLIATVSSAFLINLEIMNIRYVENRLLSFSTRHQRWRMCEFMITLACVLMELVEYIKAVIALFDREDHYAYRDVRLRLEFLRKQLDSLRFESLSYVEVLPVMIHQGATTDPPSPVA